MATTIHGLPLMVELDAYVHDIVESARELLLVSMLKHWHLVHKVDTVDKVTTYFPDNFVNLAPISDEVHVTNHGSILSSILAMPVSRKKVTMIFRSPTMRCVDTIMMAATIPALPLMAELDTCVHHIMESARELLLGACSSTGT
uniref:Uncharacterized protein n=1 Tax=Oryza punctata TaxID=4537 RepID=A0A0E0LVA6_ORYPU